MPKFKAGDRVVCVEINDHVRVPKALVLGKEYVVEEVLGGGGGPYVLVQGVFPHFFGRRFKLVEPAQPEPVPEQKAPRRKKREIRVGDVVIPSRFDDLPNLCFVPRLMEGYVGVEDVVKEIDEMGYFLLDNGWRWPKEALKRVVKRKKAVANGVVAVAPVKAPEPFKVGDVVLCGKFAEVEEKDPLTGVYLAQEMLPLVGRFGTILVISQDKKFARVDTDGHRWNWPLHALTKQKAIKLPAKKKEEPAKPCVRSELKKLVGENAGMCSYSIQFSDGTFRHQARDICHARIPKGYADGEKKPVALALNISGHIGKRAAHPITNLPTYKTFLDYMLNRSPFAFTFLTKNVDEAISLGILMDVDNATVDEVSTAAIILRQATEWSGFLTVWSKAIVLGASQDVALFASILVHADGEGYRLATDGGHKPVSKVMPISGLVSLFKKGPHKRKLPVYSKGVEGGYKIFYTMCGCDTYIEHPKGILGEESVEDFIKELGIHKEVGEGWNKVIKIDQAGFFNLIDALKELI